MELKEECFSTAFKLCLFVNKHKIKVEQICVLYNQFYLFYWEEK